MKKILPLAISLCAAMVAAAWTISWFAQSRQIKQQIEQGMNTIDPSVGHITAERVSTSGFPLKMIVTITNPTITLLTHKTAALVHKQAMVNAGNSAGVLTTPTYPEGVLSYALKGAITLRLNALSDRIDLGFEGSDTTKLAQGENKLTMVTQYDGASSCQLRLKHRLASLTQPLWDMKQFATREQWGKDLREISCHIASAMTTNLDTNQLISSFAPADLVVTNDALEKRHRGTLHIQFQGYEVMPAGDDAYLQIRRAFTPVTEDVAPMSLSLYGKQLVLFDGTFDVPDAMAQDAKAPVDIEIKQMSAANAAGNINGSAKFSANPQGNLNNGSVALNLVSSFTPKQSEIAKINIRQFLNEAKSDARFASFVEGKDKEKLEAAAFDVLPNISELGTITQKIQAGFSADKEKKTGSLNVTAFELSARDYGLTATGQLSNTETSPIPTTNVDMLCRNCLPMVDTIGNYIARVNKNMVELFPETAGKFSLAPGRVEGIKGLLAAVGIPVATIPADLRFMIKSDASGININGKPLAELMVLMQQYLPSAPPPGP